MSRAISLAARARHSTSPNPMVGAVIVRDGEVVGEGFHRRAGGPHAEVEALRQAGAAARGATVYVTLEPCAHQGRTGPCAAALVAAGVARVVIAHRDPFPSVSGRGIKQLRAAGVDVTVGDGAPESRSLNPGWLRAQREGRPFVALKFAATLDGKTATGGGESRWITGPAARRLTHQVRRAYDAVMVGAGTVIVDDPQLNARGGPVPGRQPLRVVVDGRLRSDPRARIHAQDVVGGSLVLASTRATQGRLGMFRAAGVEVDVMPSPEPAGRQVLAVLAARGISSVLVEGGGELAWSMVRDGVVDRVYGFFSPMLLGGAAAHTPVAGPGFAELQEALRLHVVSLRRVGADVLIEAVAA